MKDVRRSVLCLARATNASPEFYLKMPLVELMEWMEEVAGQIGNK